MKCESCGRELNPKAGYCYYCGTPRNVSRTRAELQGSVLTVSDRSRSISAFLVMLGFLGLHRFYAGRVLSGATQLTLTIIILLFGISSIFNEVMLGPAISLAVIVGLWVLYDLVWIFFGKFTDSYGRYISIWRV